MIKKIVLSTSLLLATASLMSAQAMKGYVLDSREFWETGIQRALEEQDQYDNEQAAAKHVQKVAAMEPQVLQELQLSKSNFHKAYASYAQEHGILDQFNTPNGFETEKYNTYMRGLRERMIELNDSSDDYMASREMEDRVKDLFLSKNPQIFPESGQLQTNRSLAANSRFVYDQELEPGKYFYHVLSPDHNEDSNGAVIFSPISENFLF